MVAVSVWPYAASDENRDASNRQPIRPKCFVMDLPRWWKIETAGPVDVQSCCSREEICVFFMRPSPPRIDSGNFFNPKPRPIDCRAHHHCDLATGRVGRG